MGLTLFAFFSVSIPVALGLFVSTSHRIASWVQGRSNEPGKFPGPRQYPIIGRIHDLPRFSMWLKFKEWADEFGPIYETSMMGQKFIIISDEDMAHELLTKQGNNFAGRPQIRALIDHKIGPMYEALQDRHETWRTQRKWVHAAMAAFHQHHFYGHIEQEVKRYLVSLLVDPVRFHNSTRELTGRIICRLAWDDAPQGKLYGDDAIETLTQMSVSGPIVNTATPLWSLGDLVGYNPWRRFEEARMGRQRAHWTHTLRVCKQRFLRGDLPSDTWAHRYMQQLVEEGNAALEQTAEQEDFAACMLGFQCLVGVVTLSGPSQFFLMSMALHPEWLKKAQEEIDAVCGDRMPDIKDYPALPTVRACIKETLRWRSGVPLGVPHQCETASEFMGVPIEKGTVILACEWNINRVPEKYPDPENYHPERWLDPSWPTYEGPLTKYPNLRDGHGMHTFGWGRRTCLGKSLADDELFLIAASVCWGFDLSTKKCPHTGEEVPIDSQATNSNVILEPLPFAIDIKPRSEERARLMLGQYSEVREKLRS
ncbi:cytochrome P450 [Stachybotrys elegans]|uniref:Cytochrome P450 n=1 Tax=Stachybotrys elegans TaxID=80388 RepID=A0A8K0WRQ7_9HYPO|nr:cytochrome P450 [Stachybotrys elegans]